MIKKIRFLLVLPFLLCFTGFNNDEEFLNSLVKKAELYNFNNPVERVFIQTDRSFYKPGDIIWFKAFLINSSDYKSLSSDLFIKLTDYWLYQENQEKSLKKGKKKFYSPPCSAGLYDSSACMSGAFLSPADFIAM